MKKSILMGLAGVMCLSVAAAAAESQTPGKVKMEGQIQEAVKCPPTVTFGFRTFKKSTWLDGACVYEPAKNFPGEVYMALMVEFPREQGSKIDDLFDKSRAEYVSEQKYQEAKKNCKEPACVFSDRSKIVAGIGSKHGITQVRVWRFETNRIIRFIADYKYGMATDTPDAYRRHMAQFVFPGVTSAK